MIIPAVKCKVKACRELVEIPAYVLRVLQFWKAGELELYCTHCGKPSKYTNAELKQGRLGFEPNNGTEE